MTNAKIINNLTVDIVNNSYGKPEIAMSEEVFRDLKLAKKQNYEVIYLKEGMVDDTENLVEEMFEEMYARLLSDLLEERRKVPSSSTTCSASPRHRGPSCLRSTWPASRTRSWWTTWHP